MDVLTQCSFPGTPTDDGRTIAAAALALWQEIGADLRIRLIGVSATNLEKARTEQLSLSLGSGIGKHDALNRALDRIAARFGREALRRGGMTVERAAPTLAIKDRPRSS